MPIFRLRTSCLSRYRHKLYSKFLQKDWSSYTLRAAVEAEAVEAEEAAAERPVHSQ